MKTRMTTTAAALVAALAASFAFAEDPYLESDGSAGINTGYRMKGGISRVEVDYQLTNAAGSAQMRVFGTTDGGLETSLRTCFYYTGDATAGEGTGQSCYFYIKDGEDNVNDYSVAMTADTQRHTLVADLKNGCWFITGDDKSRYKTGGYPVFEGKTADLPLSVFGAFANASGTAYQNLNTQYGARCTAGRLYGVKIYENYDTAEGADNSGNLVHNFVPALDRSGAVGLRDTITGMFAAGADGSGGGNVLSPGGTALAYDSKWDPHIVSDGTGGMSTGYRMNEHSRVEVDYALTDVNANQMRLFGDFSAGNEKSLQTMFYWTGTDGGTGGNYTFRISAVGSANAHDCQWTGADAISVDLARRTLVADIKNGKCQIITGGVVSSKDFAYPSTYAADFAGKTASMPLSLFGEYANTNATAFANGSNCRCSKARIYGVKIYEDYDESADDNSGRLVRNFVPCTKGGVPGFQDTLTGVFITGENPAAFAAAGDAVPAYADDSCVSTAANADGAQVYIDTGYALTAGSSVEIDCALATGYPSAGGATWTLFSSDDGVRMGFDSANGLVWSAGSSSAWQTSLADAVSKTIAEGNGAVRRTFAVDLANTLVSVSTYGFTNKTATFSSPAAASGTLKIAANGAGDGEFAPLKIYGVKIYESGTLVREFAPALNRTGEIGLRDVMTGAFAAGAVAVGGSGALVPGGAPLVYDSAYGPYVQSDGTSGISTGYRMKGGISRVEVDFALWTTEDSAQTWIFGSDSHEYTMRTMCYFTGMAPGVGGGMMFRVRGGEHVAVSPSDPDLAAKTGDRGIAKTADTDRRTLVVDLKSGKDTITSGSARELDASFNPDLLTGLVADLPLSLFAKCGNTNATALANGSKTRIYGVKIYEDYDENGENEPVHDFTPCLREGVACFRDEVTGMFITGENVDAFSVGGDYEEVDDDGYVSTVSESAAARLYIDTGHQVTDDTRVELDCAIATNMIGDVEWHIFDCNCVPRFVMDYASEALRYVAGGLEAAYAEKLDDSAFPRPTDKKEVRRTFILDNHVGMAAVVTSGFTNKTVTFSHPTTTTSAGNLVLGAYYTGSAFNAPLKIYGCKIYEGEELALDFVPCVKNGVGGLRDSMSGRFIAGSDASSNGNTLPYGGTIDVVEDPYILSKGTSGISTGYRMKGGKSRVEVDFALETVEGSGQTRIFGDTTKEASLGTMFYFTGSGTGAGFQFRNKVKGSFSSRTYDNGVAWGADLLRHTLVTDLGNGKNQIVTTNSTWTGSFTASAFEGLTADMPLSLFARYDNTNATSFAEGSHARIYGVKIYEDYDESAEDNAAKLVHNFVPCYKVGADAADKVPCFRDLVTGRFIIGEDVSAFEGGGDIPDIADDSYVSTVSDTPGEYYYIDTGYRVKDTTRVELDCALASNMLGNAMWVLFDAFENTGDDSKRFRFYYNNPNLTYWVGTSGAIDTAAFARPATGRDVRRTFVLDNVSQEAVVVTSTFTNKCVSMTRPGYNGTRTGNTLKLGCTYGDAWALGSSGLAPLKIYGCRIYESGVLVTNFTPYVLRGSAGLRDAVHKTGFVGGKVKTGSAAGVDASLPHGGDWDPYIESDGTSAISTGYRMNANSRVEVDFALSAADETGKWIFGTSSSQESSLRSGLLVDGTPAVFKFSTGTSSSGTAGDYANSAAIDSGRHTAIIDLRDRILVMETDGIQDYAKGIASVNFSGSTASLPLSLFGEWSNAAATAAANGARARIYGARIYENGTIVHNYVPCWRDDDVPCFRDAIGGGFIAGENASAFETGGDAPVYTNDMYVSTVSAAGSKMYIDTGYEVTAGTRVELDCALATNMAGSATWRIFGSDAGTEFGFKYGASGLDWSARGLAGQTQFRPAFPKPAAAGTRRTFILDNANCEAAVVTRGFTNHVEAFAASGDGAAAKTLKIASAAAATADHAPLKVYGCRIFEGGELVRDFVPYAETDGGGTLLPVGLRDVLTGRLAWGGDASGNGNALVAGGGCEPCILSSGREHTGVSTGYRMKGGVSRIEVDFQLVKALLEGRVFGNDAGDGTRFRDAKLRTVLFVESKKKNFVFYTGTGAKVVAKDANNVRQYVPADLLRHTAIMDLVNDRNVLLTGGVTNFSASTGLDLGGLVSEMPLPLFNRFFNDEGTDFSTWPSCARIYGVKIYENDELVHDFVPYFDGFESGFRDRVTGEFATGYGTAYSDATARHTYRGSVYATDAYIESDGSAGFDTGYKMVGGVSRVEVDCELTAESQCSKYIFGSSALESSLFTFFYTTATGYPTCRNGPSGQQNDHSAQWPVAHDVRRHTYVTDLRNGISAMTPCPANANLSSDLECKKSVGETAFAGAVADYPLPIFAKYATYDLATGAATWNSGARARVYSVRIYENYDASAADNSANLVHEFIPYKKGSVVGFYDTVTGEIKELSSAHFTYGGAGQDHGRFKSYVSPDHAAQLAHAGTKSAAPITAYAPGAEAYRWYDKDGMVKGVSGDSLTVRYTRGGSVDEYWSVGWYGEDFGCGVKSAPEGVKSATKGFVQCFR